MEIKIITDEKTWEDFLAGCGEKTFLQSWNWGRFNQKMGNKIWRFGFFNNNDLTGTALVTKIKAKRGIFLLVQHAPNIISEKNPDLKHRILEMLLAELKKIGAEEKAIFIRMNPLWQRDEKNEEIFKKLGFKESPMHASAYESTWKLDIDSSEKELLKKMRKTTRYLIHQAQKNSDIETIKSDKTEDVKFYNELNQKIGRHKKFAPFSFEFVKNEFDVFAKNNQALFFFGKYQGNIIASALVVFWANIGFYHQAALSPDYHKVPIAYLLQWEAIKEAKRRGCILYDFWGYVDPKLQPRHPWAGPSLFKMGFGGKPYYYLKTRDFPLSKKYWLTFAFEKLRKFKRGL